MYTCSIVYVCYKKNLEIYETEKCTNCTVFDANEWQDTDERKLHSIEDDEM